MKIKMQCVSGNGEDCGCLNPNLCDCVPSATSIELQKDLQELHEEVSTQDTTSLNMK